MLPSPRHIRQQSAKVWRVGVTAEEGNTSLAFKTEGCQTQVSIETHLVWIIRRRRAEEV
jgi:hypothetical protein